MDSTKFNPYDFANPVTDPDAFAGRKSEKADVRYYLSHARLTRPIHLALTGERSAGKTSLLNMISRQAELFEFIVVRIDLNQEDAEPIQFFARFYDALLSAVIRAGAFGGREGRTWGAYRALVDSDEVVGELPLGFPSHLVATMKGTRQLSIAVLSEDLAIIQAEADRKIAVVVDECDVLSGSRVTLQILRNLFTSLDKFMFVIAGTPQLFPVMDEVFSPIARQFKKLTVSPFEDVEETRDCMSQPLERNGEIPDEAFEDWPYVADEVHRITGGRPYEIQLLCHAMYRRVQDGLEPEMRLNLEALDTVRRDLEDYQGHNSGRKAHLFPRLSQAKLRALSMLRAVSDGRSSSALLVSAINGDSLDLDEPLFLSELEDLVALELVTIEDDHYELAGDQFDEIYLRYLAAARDIYIPAFSSHPTTHIEAALRVALYELTPLQIRSSWSDAEPSDFRQRVKVLLGGATDGLVQPRSVEWAAIYRVVKHAQSLGHEMISFASFEIKVGEFRTTTYFPVFSGDLDRCLASGPFNFFKERIETLRGELILSTLDFSITEVPIADELIPDSEAVRISIAENYDNDGYYLYAGGDYEAALDAFQSSYSMKATPSAAVAVAFQYLHLGNWQLAVQWTDKADEEVDRLPTSQLAEHEVKVREQRALAAYDRALGLIMMGSLASALEALEGVDRAWEPVLSKRVVYLLRAEYDGAAWHLEEADGNVKQESLKLREQLSKLSPFDS